MLTKIMKYAALAVALPFWQTGPNLRLILGFVISLGSALVAWQAVQAAKYGWAVGFYGIALAFNPLIAVAQPSGQLVLWAILASMTAFAISLLTLPTQRLLTVQSITSLNLRRRAL